jgi:hypothetical protein
MIARLRLGDASEYGTLRYAAGASIFAVSSAASLVDARRHPRAAASARSTSRG